METIFLKSMTPCFMGISKRLLIMLIVTYSLAERLVSSTLNLLALLRVGSNPGLGDSNFHEGKSPGWLREGRWFYPDA